ncbi:hypothetical protein HY621_00695 [Candidatus Uhrbacteria bacterium]|nr:hypothetical protein [Candidatus Uhrbacteria bacterium]
MSALQKKINEIPKPTFTFSDIRKIADMNDESLRVSMNRLVKSGHVTRIVRSVYAHDLAVVDWDRLAQELYTPSYLSFESALGRTGVLSQKPYALTLATTLRTRTIETKTKTIIYHHIQPRLYWGYIRENHIFVAESEKAFLDLAYLSLKGYATFDPDEMNLAKLDSAKIMRYLRKFGNVQLRKRVEKLF